MKRLLLAVLSLNVLLCLPAAAQCHSTWDFFPPTATLDPGESVEVSLFNTQRTGATGFAEALFDVHAITTPPVIGLMVPGVINPNLDLYANAGTAGQNSINSIRAFQLCPFFNPSFDASNPIWVYVFEFVNTSDTTIDVTFSVTATTHAWYDGCETCNAGPTCDDLEAPLDENGEVIFPPELDPNEPIIYEDVNEDRGYLEDLYPQHDTSSTDWLADLPCDLSLGGELPEGILDHDFDADLLALGINLTADELSVEMAAWESLALDEATAQGVVLDQLPRVANGFSPRPYCLEEGVPYRFGGLDIVFVHGLDCEPIADKLFGNHGSDAYTEWPADRNEFFGSGYWAIQAKLYWQRHIAEHLAGYGNRYLVVAWPSTQRIDYAAHAVLAQIHEAMEFGDDVVNPIHPDRKNGFGSRGFVVVSHSTGGLITDIAMSAAATYPQLGAQHIPAHAKLHVALQGAHSGSQFATPIVALSLLQPIPEALCKVATTLFEIDPVCLVDIDCDSMDSSVLRTSVLLDLSPLTTQLLWGYLVASTPLRTISVVNASPYYFDASGNRAPGTVLKWLLLPGYDDGTLANDSAVARSNFVLAWPARWGHSLVRAFDMGTCFFPPCLEVPACVRAASYFIDMLSPVHGGLASGPTPFLSPTGMVNRPQLIGSGHFDPFNFYPNHHPYLQSAAGHLLDEDYPCAEDVFVGMGRGLYETYANAVGDTRPVLTNLCRPKSREEVRGHRVTFFVRFFGRLYVWQWWLWKRHYHLIEGYKTRTAAEIMYDTVLCEQFIETCEPCGGDFNYDGLCDTRDVLSYLNHWAGGDDVADCNSDDIVDTTDFFMFLNGWVNCQ